MSAPEPAGLFEVIRTPAPPDVPSRVAFALRDGEHLDRDVDEHLDRVRGAGPPRPTTGPQDARAPMYWQTEARRIVLALVDAGHLVSSDDLHDRFPDEPSATGAAFGALFKSMAKQGLLRLVEHRPSRRPEARGRVVGLWTAGTLPGGAS